VSAPSGPTGPSNPSGTQPSNTSVPPSRPSTVPPPGEGSNARYAIAGVVLAALAGLALCMMQGEDPPPAAVATPDAGPPPSRSTALVEDSLEIPEIEPDAGTPDAGTPATTTGRRPPRVATSDWDCTGELGAAAAATVVRGFDSQIRSCYERRLKANPLLSGNMSLSIKVNEEGAVDGVQVGGSLRDRDVFSCVRGVAMRMRFPRVEGGSCAVVNVPYAFTPEE
jgi:hypothetical protein